MRRLSKASLRTSLPQRAADSNASGRQASQPIRPKHLQDIHTHPLPSSRNLLLFTPQYVFEMSTALPACIQSYIMQTHCSFCSSRDGVHVKVILNPRPDKFACHTRALRSKAHGFQTLVPDEHSKVLISYLTGHIKKPSSIDFWYRLTALVRFTNLENKIRLSNYE